MSLESESSVDGHSTVSQETTIIREMKDDVANIKRHSR